MSDPKRIKKRAISAKNNSYNIQSIMSTNLGHGRSLSRKVERNLTEPN
jgi:hypothetical protein